jgi:hypothetical protein
MARAPVPFGYRLEPDPREQDIIKGVREARASGTWSLGAMSKALAKHGYLSRTGKPFTRTQLARMVTDRADAAER